jgi:curved DNA-binding protein CbpA
LISEAYSVLSDPQKKQEYDSNKKFGGNTEFSNSNFRKSNFNPFDIFQDFFGRRDPFFEDNDDFGIGFGKGSKFGGFGGFGGFGDFDNDDFFKRSTNGGFQFDSNTFGGNMSTSIKKTTQIM